MSHHMMHGYKLFPSSSMNTTEQHVVSTHIAAISSIVILPLLLVSSQIGSSLVASHMRRPIRRRFASRIPPVGCRTSCRTSVRPRGRIRPVKAVEELAPDPTGASVDADGVCFSWSRRRRPSSFLSLSLSRRHIIVISLSLSCVKV